MDSAQSGEKVKSFPCQFHLDTDIKKEWEDGIPSEICFWENWIAAKGGRWDKEYNMRTDPESELQEIFLKYINKSLPRNKILDVGAGPLTIVNKKCDLTELEIYAVDPLADEYNRLLRKYNVQPIVETQKLDGEKLTEKCDIDSFDISYSRNAIDHAYAPLKIIEEMIAVTKEGGYIILQIGIKDGSHNNWSGLHNWDFFPKENDLFLKGKNTVEFNVTQSFKDFVKLIQITIEKNMMTIVFKKRGYTRSEIDRSTDENVKLFEEENLTKSDGFPGQPREIAGDIEKEYSNLIALKDFFEDVDDYVILKLSDDFPDYFDYSDIDILCRNRDSFLAHILKVGKAYEERGFQIKVSRDKGNLHVDFHAPMARRLNFRFDLLDSVSYEKFLVAPQFSDIVLANRRQINRKGVDIQVPALEHDLAIRFLEYIEWQDRRPDKAKHVEYIKKHNCLDFVEVVNKYTNLRVCIEQINGKTNLNVHKKNTEQTSVKAEDERNQQSFYKLSPTCQIPELGAIYEEYFGRRTNGCFVEVGAFDGEYVSNTSGLADVGWTGYYIEPVPEYFQRCKARHARNKNVTVSQFAIGAESGIVEVNIGGALSTISEEMKRNFESLDWAKGSFGQSKKVQAEQLTLDNYLAKHGVKSNFELLVVDVEGYEWNVFRNFNIEKWCPQMVIVELHDKNDDYLLIREDCKNIVRYFDGHNYKAIYKDSTNTIYVLNASPVVKQRIDYFLIWGHGLQYTRQILDIIRSVKDFQIITIVKKHVGDMRKFVQDIYSCDTVPLQHLVGKTQYLLNTRPEIIFILVENNNPREKFFGEGAFRHIQCALVKDIKEEIRDKFNPRINGKRTEEHVIHASDYETQVEHVLKVLGLPSIEFYTREPNTELDVPHHIKPFGEYSLTEVNIDDLRANILGAGVVPIIETPHYKYLTGDKQSYEAYYEKFSGWELTDDHCSAAYDKLVADFKYGRMIKNGKKSLILAEMHDDSKYHIIDGVHRAAILKFQGFDTITIAEPVIKTEQKRLTGLIFSKDRPMQLQAAIESFFLHCKDSRLIDLFVLYKSSDIQFEEQYNELNFRFDSVTFIPEADFRYQVLSALENRDYILFLVDDNIFIRSFSLKDIVTSLQKEPDAIGFSLRLGKNTNYCYTLDSPQALPQFIPQNSGILKYCWLDQQCDFGYPLEVSSSVYRCKDISRLLNKLDFSNPNTLEGIMNDNKNFDPSLKYLLIFEESVTFCNPVNVVQSIAKNRFGVVNNYTAQQLAEYFDEGKVIDIEKYTGFTPNAAHQEVELHFKQIGEKVFEPKFSVVMANYNNQKYIADAIESVLAQTFRDWQLIIVDDCSTDNSLNIINQYLEDKRIKLVRHKKNLGYTATLKTGIANVTTKFFGILDSDDLLMPDAIKTMYTHHTQYPNCGFVYSQFVACCEDMTPRRLGFCDKIPVGKTNLEANLVSHFKTFRLEDYLKTPGYDEDILYAEDTDIIFKMEEVTRLAYVDQALYLYRELQNSQCHDSQKALISKQSWEKAKANARKRRLELLAKLLGPNADVPADKLILTDTKDYTPEFSVVMANYNNAKYLGQAIKSVLNQSFKNWELIIVDDGSTDNSLDAIQPYLKDKRIKLIRHEQNKGCPTAEKTAIAHVRSPYFGILDSDDCLAFNAIEVILAEHLANPDCGFIYAQMQYCDQNFMPFKRGINRAIEPDETSLDCDISQWRTFKLADYLKTEGLDEELEFGEDKDTIYKMEEVTKLKFVDKALYLCRELPHSQCHSDKSSKIGKFATAKAKINAIKRRCAAQAKTENINYQQLLTKEIKNARINYLHDVGSYFLTLKKVFLIIQEVHKNGGKLKYLNPPEDFMARDIEDAVMWLALNMDIRKIFNIINVIHSYKDLTDEPFLSVCIAAKENTSFLKQAIDSVLSQNYFHYELLIVDGSSDGSLKEIVNSRSSSKIKYIRKPYINIASALNRAVITAQGKYVIAINPDDFIEPDYIRKLVACAEKNPDFNYFYPAKKVVVDEFNNPKGHLQFPDFAKNPVLPANDINKLIPDSGSLKRKSIFKLEMYAESEHTVLFKPLLENLSQIKLKRIEQTPDYYCRQITSNQQDKLSPIYSTDLQIQTEQIQAAKPFTFQTTKFNSSDSNNNEIKISVIVPCYNQAHYLPEAIESIVNQTYKHWQCIIVNDASTDNTKQVAKQLIAKYPNYDIQLIDKPQNTGLADTRNVGIEAATSEWLLPLDSDDKFQPTFMQKAVDIIHSNPNVDIVFANLQEFGAGHNQWIPADYSQQQIMIEDTMPYASLYRKQLWSKVGGYDNLMSIIVQPEDWNFWISCSEYNPVVKRIHEKLFLYRVDPQSMYHKTIKHNLELAWAFIATCHPNLYPVVRLAQAWQIIANCPDSTYEKILKAVEKYPERGLVYFWRGLIRRCRGKVSEVIEDYQLAVEHAEQGDWQALFALMMLQKNEGDLIGARGSLKKLLTVRPDFVRAEDMLPRPARRKVLFYYDRIGNPAETRPAGTVVAMCNFAKMISRNNPDIEPHITGDLVSHLELYESLQFIPLPLPGKRAEFLANYDMVFFATHVRYFKGLAKPAGQIWVLCQHCWQADDIVSLSHMSDFDAVVCLSELHKASLNDHGIEDEKLLIIPNFIDTEVYSPKDTKRDNHSIMYAGALHEHKCLDILMDAFQLVRHHVPDAELHLYGDSGMWRGDKAYGNELESTKPQGVYFHGYVDNKDMPQVYSKHSILCLPSKYETFPMVILESQACGCIPVAHDAGGTAATVANGKTGFLYSPNTPEKLAETIIKAIGTIDNDQSIRRRAVDFIQQNFSMARGADYLSKLWDGIAIAREVKAIRALLESNDIEQASLDCKQLLQKYPTQPDVVLLQALIMLREGNEPKANLIIQELLEKFPTHIRALNDCGLMAMKAGDSKKAFRYLTKAYKFNPWDKNTNINCYTVLKTSGKYREAKSLIWNYLMNVGEDAQILQLFREVNNLVTTGGSGVNVISQNIGDNKLHVDDKADVNAPLVTVIMPVYNGADYIGQAVESVLAQSCPKFELVIVDDGSTDNTKQVIRKYNDERIKYFYKENGGVSSARNLAIKKAKGQYIMPLDSDDMMTPDFIAKHLQEFEKHPEADLVYSDVLLVESNGSPIRVMNKPEYQNRRHMIRDLFRCGHPIIPFRLGIRRSVFDKIGLYDEKLLVAEDYDMMRRFVKAGLNAHHLAEPLHIRRMQPNSLSRDYTAQKAKSHFEVIKRFTDTFAYDELFPDIAWDKIAPERRQLHVKCLAAVTCLAIGQAYIKSNSPVYAKTAFGQACSELTDCLKIDPRNQRVRQLLQKCEFAQTRCEDTVQQAVC